MPTHRKVLLHQSGPAYWPTQKPLDEVLALKARTPEHIWTATYQGVPMAPGGTVFKRDWWRDKNRFDHGDRRFDTLNLRRWISCDTAGSLAPNAAFSAFIVAELTRDYRLAIREVQRDKYEFPDLVDAVAALSRRHVRDEKLSGVIIETKASGLPLVQSIMRTGDPWLKRHLWGFDPAQDKETRARYAASWCARDCVLLPYPSEPVAWLIDFEDELFNYTGVPDAGPSDQVDAFSQLILRVEQYLQRGYEARERWLVRRGLRPPGQLGQGDQKWKPRLPGRPQRQIGRLTRLGAARAAG